MESLSGGSGASGGSGRGLRRSVSAPELLNEASLESLTDAALGMETTPCSVLQLHALDDEVAASLRQTLQETQRELLEAVRAGVLSQGGRADSGQAASEEERQRSCAAAGSSGSGSGADALARLQQAAPAAQAAVGELEFVVDEAELAGLSAREREAAIKRAKNREAARRSRERKVERIGGLRAEVEALRNNNFVLLKCIEEVTRKALAARGEQKQLRDKLTRLTGQQAQQAVAPAHMPTSVTCTPPPARRAVALEEDLILRLDVGPGPASPSHLLLPHWPDHAAADVAAPLPPAAAAAQQHRTQLPTSAELRRQLQEALAGGGGWEGRAAADHHHLHPSPVAAGRAQHPRHHHQQPAGPFLHPAEVLQQQQQQQQLQHRSVVHLKEPGILRACSAPDGLLGSATNGVGVADAAGAGVTDAAPTQQPWFRGVAA